MGGKPSKGTKKDRRLKENKNILGRKSKRSKNKAKQINRKQAVRSEQHRPWI